jgi:hypothetical protein
MRNVKTKTRRSLWNWSTRQTPIGVPPTICRAAASRVAVRVIRTDEERMIAKMVCRVLGLPRGKEMGHEDEED